MNRSRFLVALLVMMGAGAWYYSQPADQRPPMPQAAPGPRPGAPRIDVAAQRSTDAVRQAFEARRDGVQILTEGSVTRILADDNDGSRHQRFIIRTDSGISLLIAHNIDLAPRLQGVAAGDRVQVAGEYEWNEQGGVIHWTHLDPAGRHAAGHIEWRGRRYQ